MTDKGYRSERDSMGELQVPENALYGAQTQRAIENFPISGQPIPGALIHALGYIKAACATVNGELGLLQQNFVDAINQAAGEVADGKHDAQFPVDVFQTGSGTSSNMNVNEVIARLAAGIAGESIHANDHVNMGQSSNDVFPAAIHVSACLEINTQLLPALDHLAQAIDKRAGELSETVTTGRTHLMDAMPVTLGQQLTGWSHQIRQNMYRIQASLTRLCSLPLGGTAVGTGINTPEDFGPRVAEQLTRLTSVRFRSSENFFAGLSSQDSSVEMSGHLKTTAVSLMKISNDLRWMNSGPLAGLAEIALPALQPGSSIMPGKVNPVMPEAVTMVCAQVMGNDTTVTVAGQSGNFQLNVMLPVIGYNLLQSIELLGNAARLLADKAIAGFEVNAAKLQQALERNPILVTALNPVIGYEKGAAIAKRAYAEGRPVLEVALEMTDLSAEELTRLLEPLNLTRGGLPEQK